MYRLDIIDRHVLVVLDGGRALLDTGSPFDIGRGRATELLGVRWDPPSLHAAALDVAQDHLGIAIEWLIGHPTLRRCRLLVDWTARAALVDPGALAGTRVPIDLALPVPVIDLVVTDVGLAARAVLDSGAALSYVPCSAVVDRTPVRTERDFHPSIGPFDVEVWALPITVGGRAIALEAAVLPPPLDRLLGGGCGGWILGSDFFRDRAIVLDYADRSVLDAPGGVLAG